jgi:hypothetical protein
LSGSNWLPEDFNGSCFDDSCLGDSCFASCFFASCFFASCFVASCFVSFLTGSCFCDFSPAGPGFCACFGAACLACFSGACFDGACFSCGCFGAAAAPSPKQTRTAHTMAPARPATPPNPELRANPRQVRMQTNAPKPRWFRPARAGQRRIGPSGGAAVSRSLIGAFCRGARMVSRDSPARLLSCTGLFLQSMIELSSHYIHYVPPDHARARAIAGRTCRTASLQPFRNPSCGEVR